MKDQSVIVKAFEFLFPFIISVSFSTNLYDQGHQYDTNRYECWRDALGVVCGRGRTDFKYNTMQSYVMVCITHISACQML